MGYFNYSFYLLRLLLGRSKLKKLFFIGFFVIVFLLLLQKFCFGWTGEDITYEYIFNNTSYTIRSYGEENGNLVLCNTSNGSPNRCWYAGGGDTARSSLILSNNHLNSLQTNNRSYYRPFQYTNNVWNCWVAGTSYSGQIDLGNTFVLISTWDIYDEDGNLYLQANKLNNRYVSAPIVAPSILISQQDMQAWNFDILEISFGSNTYYSDGYYGLYITHNGVLYSDLSIGQYYDNLGDLNLFNVPRNVLNSDFVIRNGDTIKIELYSRDTAGTFLYNLGTYNISLSSTAQEEIQEDSTTKTLGDIKEGTQATNQKLDNLENTITDGDIDDISAGDLPSDSTTDITADGVNGIFTSIYNAFCVGNAQDIVFPIPFTNKNITLSPNYVYNMLNSSNAGWVITIIQAFWWYLISRFIVKDIMNKINKIKGGNIEDIETENIRGDML